MVVRYIGGNGVNCEACSAHTGKHSYEWELLMKDSYPADYNVSKKNISQVPKKTKV